MPAALDLAPLAALAVVTFAILLLFAYKATVGAVVDWLIGHVPEVKVSTYVFGTIDVFGWITGPLKSFQNLVYRTLGNLIETDKRLWNRFVTWNAYVWDQVSGAITEVAHETERSLGYLARSKIPLLILAALNPVNLAIVAIREAIKTLAAEVAAAAHVVQHVTVRETNTTKSYVQKVFKGASLAAVAGIAAELPGLRKRVQEAEDAATKAFRAARSASTGLAVGAAAGLVAYALSKLKMGWLRCSNVDRVAKQVCGLDHDLLDSLLADSALILGTVSLVEFAEGMQTVTGDFAQAVKFFWRA